MKRSTKEEFIEKACAVHGDKYNYDKVVYINNQTKVCITCPIHGDFWQRPDGHLSGKGCSKCGGTSKSSKDEFIEKANTIHNNKYSYEKTVYKNNHENVVITCPLHGDFEQTPHNHLKGKGCPVCGKESAKHSKYTQETFVEEATKVHDGFYTYDNADYKNLRNKVKITCPTHGDFIQIAYLHINGAGCPTCAKEKQGLKKRKSTDSFVEQAKEKHGDKYDYSLVDYKTAKNKVAIICPKHGVFYQSPWHHISGCGCPKCVQMFSKDEVEIFEYVKNILGNNEVVLNHDRNTLEGKELDIYIPSKKLAIEYNGLYWHTINVVKKQSYHLNKLELCEQRGIKLIQVFEDEYIEHKDIVLSKIKHLLGCDDILEKVYGRKCIVNEITKKDSDTFLLKNHIQGPVSSTVYLGAYNGDVLVGVMLFKKSNISGNWELTRFACDITKHCIGIGGKLLSYFIKSYNPLTITSFADRRWSSSLSDNLYIKLGFKEEYKSKPDYRYYNPNDGAVRQHKFKFRKQALHRKYGLPLTMTENQMTKKLGYKKIYDCGLIKYVWTKK